MGLDGGNIPGQIPKVLETQDFIVSFCPLVVVALVTELRTRLGKCSCLSCNSCSTPRTDVADLGVESFPTLISPMPAPPVPGYFLPEAGLRKAS